MFFASTNNEKLIFEEERQSRASRFDLMTANFYKQQNWFEEMCEILFKIKQRGTTIKLEVQLGFIHFISCFYCLALLPQQLSPAGYNSRHTIVSTALCAGLGSIFCGIFANLPFVLAPPTVVSIFLSVFLQEYNYGPAQGDLAVIISGASLLLLWYRPLGVLISRLIPLPIQVGTAIGIGLLTALAGCTDINVVERGTYNILKFGAVTPEVCIAFFGVFIICVAINYRIRVSFCMGIIICSIMWWSYDNSFPTSVVASPEVSTFVTDVGENSKIPLLIAELIFLYLLYLNGIVSALGDNAHLTRETDNTIPRGRWIFLLCGLFTVMSGFLSAAPILVSPESAASIKAGAKTGLSTVICGLLFLLALFFSPIFEDVPSAGTSPILIMIGVMLFQNVSRLDWRQTNDAAPAFIVLFFIPFTYSIIQGVIFGYIMYLTINIFSGDLFDNSRELVTEYLPQMEKVYSFAVKIAPFISKAKQLERSGSSGGSSSGSNGGRQLAPEEGGSGGGNDGTLTEASSYSNGRLPSALQGDVVNPVTGSASSQSHLPHRQILFERRRSATLFTEEAVSPYSKADGRLNEEEILRRDIPVAVDMIILSRKAEEDSPVQGRDEQNNSDQTDTDPSTSNINPAGRAISDSSDAIELQKSTKEEKVVYI